MPFCRKLGRNVNRPYCLLLHDCLRHSPALWSFRQWLFPSPWDLSQTGKPSSWSINKAETDSKALWLPFGGFLPMFLKCCMELLEAYCLDSCSCRCQSPSSPHPPAPNPVKTLLLAKMNLWKGLIYFLGVLYTVLPFPHLFHTIYLEDPDCTTLTWGI